MTLFGLRSSVFQLQNSLFDIRYSIFSCSVLALLLLLSTTEPLAGGELGVAKFTRITTD